MNTEHAEQSQILTIGKTPAQWVEIMPRTGSRFPSGPYAKRPTTPARSFGWDGPC